MKHERLDGPSQNVAAQRPRRAVAQALQKFVTRCTVALLAISALALAGCFGNGSNAQQPPNPPSDLAAQGQLIFRYWTFGDEATWTNKLQMNQVIQQAVDPLTAASVGIKIDADALPSAVVAGIQNGSIPLNDPQTTLALIQMNAVVGIQGDVQTDATTGKLVLKSVGITCALCHSTVSTDVTVTAKGDPNVPDGTVLIPAGIVGHRLDGWPNRDLNPGAIIALSPAVANTPQAAVYNSWGPGKYDARFNMFLNTTNPLTGQQRGILIFEVSNASTSPDGTTKTYDPFAVEIPPAYGLAGISREIYTGDGDLAHEPVGPVAYWNRYVSVTQMGGIGTFDDPRLDALGMMPVNHITDGTNVNNLPDQVTSFLPALQAYQLSIAAPNVSDPAFAAEATALGVKPDPNAVARGEQVFNGAGQCASCHTGTLFTDANYTLHPQPDSAARDTSYVLLSATQEWRTSPLSGIWEHPPYFHDGSGQFVASTGKCADGSSIGSLTGTTAVTEDLACVVNMYNTKLNLGLTNQQQSDLVQYLESL